MVPFEGPLNWKASSVPVSASPTAPDTTPSPIRPGALVTKPDSEKYTNPNRLCNASPAAEAMGATTVPEACEKFLGLKAAGLRLPSVAIMPLLPEAEVAHPTPTPGRTTATVGCGCCNISPCIVMSAVDEEGIKMEETARTLTLPRRFVIRMMRVELPGASIGTPAQVRAPGCAVPPHVPWNRLGRVAVPRYGPPWPKPPPVPVSAQLVLLVATQPTKLAGPTAGVVPAAPPRVKVPGSSIARTASDRFVVELISRLVTLTLNKMDILYCGIGCPGAVGVPPVHIMTMSPMNSVTPSPRTVAGVPKFP